MHRGVPSGASLHMGVSLSFLPHDAHCLMDLGERPGLALQIGPARCTGDAVADDDDALLLLRDLAGVCVCAVVVVAPDRTEMQMLSASWPTELACMVEEEKGDVHERVSVVVNSGSRGDSCYERTGASAKTAHAHTKTSGRNSKDQT